jgi:putative sigma-54 modulation protein
MEMRITGNVSISNALRNYTKRNLRMALSGAMGHINEIQVRLSDINGPRGGVDKLCGIRVVLRRVGVVFVRANSGDAYSAVDMAAQRLRSALGRQIGRRRSTRRRSHDAVVGAFG